MVSGDDDLVVPEFGKEVTDGPYLYSVGKAWVSLTSHHIAFGLGMFLDKGP